MADAIADALDATRAVDVGALFRRLTLQVIAEATLSMTPEESDEVLPRLYEPLVAEVDRVGVDREPGRDPLGRPDADDRAPVRLTGL